MKKVLIVMMALCLGLVPVVSAGRGQVLYQIWDGTTGALPELKANPDFPDNPTSTWVLPSIDGAVNRLNSAYAAIDNFGSRISGWIIPPETANYTFRICSDDNGELWLSTNADPNNVRLVSHINASAGHNAWTDTDIVVDQANIPLQAGQKYYFEAIQDENAGGDNVSVGWISDGTVIGTSYTVVDYKYVWIPARLAALGGDNPGTVLYEYYNGIGAGNVSNLTGNVNYPDNPTGKFLLFNGVDGPSGWADDYGSRITGYIIPPETANYRFKVCVDDRAELYLSTDDDPANLSAAPISICSSHATSRYNFIANTITESLDIPLVAGKKYFFMSLMAEGTGGDYHSVGWVSDGTVIGGITGGVSTWVAGTANVIGRDYVTALGYWASVNVSPEDGAVGVNPSQDIKLQWAPGFMAKPIVQYRVYFSDDPAIGVPDAGQTPLAVVAADDPNGVIIHKNTLVEGVDYYWRVDAFAAPSKGLGDPNNKAGDMWTFKTIRTTPIVDKSPANVDAWRDEVVTFSVDVRSGENNNQGALTYDWRDDSGSLGAPSLPILEVTVGTEDRHFSCAVTNINSIAPEISGTATLHVKKWVGWWKFDEGSGTVAHDSSPDYFRITATPNDAVRAGAGTNEVWTSEGKIDGALALDGDGEYFTTNQLPSTLGIVGNNPRSFSVWVKTMGWNNGGIYDMGDHSSAAHDFSLRTLSGTAYVDRWRLQYYGADRDFWTWRDEGNRVAETRGWFFQTYNTWTHFVHIHDGANTKVYANGILIINWARPLDTFDVHPLEIGVYNHSNEFQGLIDDLRVFNFALSRQDVIDIYVEGEPGASFCDGSNPADVNNDCKVDIKDLADVAGQYLGSGIRSN